MAPIFDEEDGDGSTDGFKSEPDEFTVTLQGELMGRVTKELSLDLHETIKLEVG